MALPVSRPPAPGIIRQFQGAWRISLRFMARLASVETSTRHVTDVAFSVDTWGLWERSLYACNCESHVLLYYHMHACRSSCQQRQGMGHITNISHKKYLTLYYVKQKEWEPLLRDSENQGEGPTRRKTGSVPQSPSGSWFG